MLASSRASPLPQWTYGKHKIHIQHISLWERACSRRGQHKQLIIQATHHLSPGLTRNALAFASITRYITTVINNGKMK